MSFKLSMREGFARMFSKPIFQVVDPVAKLDTKGNNVIFGRS